MATLCAHAAGAATITVNSGGDLQAALNAAQPGDTILLQPGATFVGNFKLPAKNGSAYITLRSAAPDSSLPAAGQRITPAYASLLPKIKVTTSGGTALITAVAASYWRLQFLEFLPGMLGAADLVGFGRSGSAQDTLAEVPHHLIMDRCYLHGSPTTGQRRGLTLNSGETQIINSYFSDFKGINEDTQALGGSNGPGPYLIENNYIEAAGENIMFGGNDPSIPNLVPSNITIRRNLITKQLAWMSQSWVVKNLIEFKNAASVLVEGNIIENNWSAGQQGYSILFTPRNQSGTAPWSVVKNITVQNNIIRHVAAGFNISGYDDLHPSQQTHGIAINNNLFYDVSKAYATPNHAANGWMGIIGGGPRDITIDHNTVDNDGTIFISLGKGYAPTGWQIFGMRVTSNLFRDNKYGLFGNESQPGLASWTMYAPDGVFQGNAVGGAPAATFPPGNDYPTLAEWLAGFVNVASHDYRLVSTSPSIGGALDGTDIGVHFTALNAAMATTGVTVDPSTSPPPPSGGSTPYGGTAPAAPATIQFENYDVGGEGVAYHDTTSGNSGGQYRSNSVDIGTTADSGGGYNIGWVHAGEWLKYTVNVTAGGTYALDLRVAQNGTGGTFHVEVDGANRTGAIAVPNTGGWQVWTTVTRTGISLTAGVHVVRVVMDADGSGGSVANFNWFRIR
jgi:Carbohydrate binding module (family 6)